MTLFLIGGGWTAEAREAVYGPFLRAAGDRPTVACVVLDEGDGAAQFERWATALTATRPCTPVPVLVPEGGRLEVASLGGADGLLVCGGLTPAYAAALAPSAEPLRDWLVESNRPYAGFSAGAAVAAGRAVVGGWREDGVVVCPEDAAEDLDELSVVPGLGLVPFALDVHAAQWGTLARLVAAVHGGRVTSGVALDEDTLLTVTADAPATVAGLGQAHVVRVGPDGVTVRSHRAGEKITGLG